jgi:hypothetical protein
MRITIFLIALTLLILSSCSQEKISPVNISQELNGEGVTVELLNRAGESGDTSFQFVALPFNVAKNKNINSKDSLFIILSSSIAADSVRVIPFAKIKLNDDGLEKAYIVATLNSEQRLSFSDLITEYSSTKWMVEYYLSNYKGLGKINFDKWEPYSYSE